MAPRKAKSSAADSPSQTLIIDNGAHTCKAGLVSSSSSSSSTEEPFVFPNSLARDRARKTYIASDISTCTDFSELQVRRPIEKGLVISWDVERAIWEKELIGEGSRLGVDPKETRLVLGESGGGEVPVLGGNADQMVFEEFGFKSYFRGAAGGFNAYHDVKGIFGGGNAGAAGSEGEGEGEGEAKEGNNGGDGPAELVLVVDSGFSHTTITPLLKGRPIHSALRRVDVGGKLLTSYLTRLLSLRHFDMRNDAHIVNEIKEATCFVSQDFSADLDRAWKGTKGDAASLKKFREGSGGLAVDYVLPDFHTRMKGVVVEYDPARHTKAKKLAQAKGDLVDEDAITLRNERFAVPELLFHPSDASSSSPQPGIPDAILSSLSSLPQGLWPGLLGNILLVGGNAKIPGLATRLRQEVVERFPGEIAVRVEVVGGDPVTGNWRGMRRAVEKEGVMERLCVTREEYEERGGAWVAHRFATWGMGVN